MLLIRRHSYYRCTRYSRHTRADCGYSNSNAKSGSERTALGFRRKPAPESTPYRRTPHWLRRERKRMVGVVVGVDAANFYLEQKSEIKIQEIRKI